VRLASDARTTAVQCCMFSCRCYFGRDVELLLCLDSEINARVGQFVAGTCSEQQIMRTEYYLLVFGADQRCKLLCVCD
jgi:hypothetical protein